VPQTILSDQLSFTLTGSVGSISDAVVTESSFLNCCLLNARSIKNKMPELRHLLTYGNYDIICFVETWLNESITDSMLIEGVPYRLIRRDRGSHAGGIAVFFKI